MQRLEKKHNSMLGKKTSKASAGEFRCGDAIHGQWRSLDVGSAVARGNGSQVSNENRRGKLPLNSWIWSHVIGSGPPQEFWGVFWKVNPLYFSENPGW